MERLIAIITVAKSQAIVTLIGYDWKKIIARSMEKINAGSVEIINWRGLVTLISKWETIRVDKYLKT